MTPPPTATTLDPATTLDAGTTLDPGTTGTREAAVASPLGAVTAAPPRPRTEAVPLARRPRRRPVRRAPSQRAAARALRRTAAPTTGRTWRRTGLPGAARAAVGVPVSESVTSCTAAALPFVPLALWVGVGPAVGVGAVVVGVLAYVLWARRVVVGDGWVAVRQLGRYHVATVDHLRHLELKPSGRGGVLCLHTDDGRCMRLRRVELADARVGGALRAMWSGGGGTHDERVAELLELPADGERIRHRYLADAVG